MKPDTTNRLTLSTVNMRNLNDAQLETAAGILHESFKENWPDAWPTLESAREEVQHCLEKDRISIAALGTDGSVIGWIGGISNYDGKVWELHPLCVAPSHRKIGAGATLVTAFEHAVVTAGGITVTLGTDDENCQTSLGGVDLYDDLWTKIREIKNLKEHPFTFYQRLGYQIVGVVPDANGFGKPDILMAKRVGS